MRLYPRKINSIGELRQEREMLLQSREQAATEKKASGKKGKKRKKQQEEEAQSPDYMYLLGRLLQPGTLLEKAVAIAIPLFEFTPLGPASRKIFVSIAKEVGGGYLRWKALRLGIKLFGVLADALTAEPGKENKRGKAR